MYKIEKNIPMPVSGKGVSSFPIEKLKVGDSILVEPKYRQTLFTIIRNHSGNGAEFTTRTVEGGIRVWRIK